MREPRRPRFVVRRGLALALVALTAACSAIPTSGSVNRGRDLQLEREDPALQFVAQKPVPGADPASIVQGFLQANADFTDDHAVARLYLAPQVRRRWDPDTGTALYDRAEGFTVETAGSSTVVASATQVAAISAEGAFQRAPANARLTRPFQLTQVGGEWRIAGLEDGLVIASSDVGEIFRQVNLYFLAPSRTILSADTLFLPALPGLSTTLVSRLLRGPTTSMRGAVTTAFPQGTSLEPPSVPVRDGVAVVNLSDDARLANEDARALMSAQLVWTLKQLPEVQAVRVNAGGEPLGVPGVPEDQPTSSWLAFDPAGLSEDADAFAARGGRIWRLVDDRFVAVVGPFGTGALPVQRPAVALDTSRIAAVSADGRTLYTAPTASDGEATAQLTGGDFAPPSWDPDGNLWVVDRDSGRVWLLPADGDRATQIEVPGPAAGRVERLRVSRDGTRVAVVLGSGGAAGLYVGPVLRDDLDEVPSRLGKLVEVLPALRGVRDVAWEGATSLAVLGGLDGSPVLPYRTDSDGYLVSAVEPQPDLVSIAAAPFSAPIVTGTGARDGSLRQYSDGRGWTRLGPGTDPAYPG